MKYIWHSFNLFLLWFRFFSSWGACRETSGTLLSSKPTTLILACSLTTTAAPRVTTSCRRSTPNCRRRFTPAATTTRLTLTSLWSPHPNTFATCPHRRLCQWACLCCKNLTCLMITHTTRDVTSCFKPHLHFRQRPLLLRRHGWPFLLQSTVRCLTFSALGKVVRCLPDPGRPLSFTLGWKRATNSSSSWRRRGRRRRRSWPETFPAKKWAAQTGKRFSIINFNVASRER